jgi:hypothetical protein
LSAARFSSGRFANSNTHRAIGALLWIFPSSSPIVNNPWLLRYSLFKNYGTDCKKWWAFQEHLLIGVLECVPSSLQGIDTALNTAAGLLQSQFWWGFGGGEAAKKPNNMEVKGLAPATLH